MVRDCEVKHVSQDAEQPMLIMSKLRGEWRSTWCQAISPWPFLTEKVRTWVCREVEEAETKTRQLHHVLLLHHHGVTQFLHIPKQKEDALRLSLRHQGPP